MKKFGAIFYKEFLETRWQTLTFLIAGLLVPFFAKFNRWYYVDGFELSRFVMGGIVATWLNLTALCATAFAREREANTMETLRRTSPDWRVAAAGKFGYAFLSTLALGVFFFLVTLCVDLTRELRLTTTFASFFETNSGYGLSAFLQGSGMGAAFCWGIFWTGRVSRQISAIFLAFFSAMVCGIVASTFLPGAEVDLPCFAVGVVAMALAPLGNRFGYRSLNAPLASSDESIENEGRASGENRFLDPRNPKLKTVKPSASWALLRHALAQTAIVFRSPASILFEVAAVVLVCAFLQTSLGLAYAQKSESGKFLALNAHIVISLFVLYCAALGSGLFADLKMKGAPVKERFNVGFGRYWLVNALAALVVVFVLCLGAFLFSGGAPDASPRFALVHVAPYAALLFGLILWGASTPAGRLVATAASIVLMIAILAGLSSIFPSDDARLVPFVYGVALLFTVGSVFNAAACYKGKKPGLIALAPVLLVVVAFAATSCAFRAREDRLAGIPQKLDATGRPIFENLPKLKNRKDYEKYVEQTRQNLKVDPLCHPSQDVMNNPQWQDVDKAVKETEKAFAMTKRFAAGVNDSVESEKKLYETLRRQFVRSFAPKNCFEPTLETLERIKESRPSYDEIAANRYVYVAAQSRLATPSLPLNLFLQSRGKRLESVVQTALWNSSLSAQKRGDFIDETLYGYRPIDETSLENNALRPAALPLAEGTLPLAAVEAAAATAHTARDAELRESDVYNAVLSALDVDCSAVPIEIQRRLIYLTLAVRNSTQTSFQTPQSYGQILADRTSDPLCVPRPKTSEDAASVARNERSVETLFDSNADRTSLTGLYPLVARPAFTAPVVALPESHEGLLRPFTDVDGAQLTIPDGRQTFRASTVTVVNVESGVLAKSSGEKIKLQRHYFALYNDQGAPLLDVSGAQYYGCDYNAVDWRGEPVYFLLEPLDEEPPFKRDGLDLYDGYRKEDGALMSGANPPEWMIKSFVSRVRAVKLFDQEGENSFVVKDLWYIHKNPEAAKPEGGPAPVDPSQGGPAPIDQFVDSEGNEVLDRDGKPRFARKSGAFLDKRHVCEPNFPYAFDLPDGIAKNAENLRVVYTTGVGTYKDVDAGVAVENGRVYSMFPAVGLAASSSWYLSPSLDPEKVKALYDESPVLIIEPLDPGRMYVFQ